MPILNLEQTKLAKDWLIDCFPDDVDEIRTLNEKQLATAVNRHCDRGVHGLDWGHWNPESKDIPNRLIKTYGLRDKS